METKELIESIEALLKSYTEKTGLIVEHVRVDYQTDSTAKKETTNYMIEVNLSKQR